MPKPKNPVNSQAVKGPEANGGQKERGTNGIKIKVRESSIAEFTKRNVPSENEVEKFEEMINNAAYTAGSGNAENTEREEEIDESLNEIYQDDNGGMVNVKKLEIQKRHGVLYWVVMPLVAVGVIAAVFYGAYEYFYLQAGSDATAVNFSITGQSEITAGEEYFYTINYGNDSNVPLNNIRISAAFPENFIFLDSFPETDGEHSVWTVETVPARYSGTIKIKGKMIAPVGATGFVSASLTYTPDNFSSEFKKESSLTTTVRDIGIDFDIDFLSSVLVGEENEIIVKFRGKEENFINDFRLTVEPKENIEFKNADGKKKLEHEAEYVQPRPGVFEVKDVTPEEAVLPIRFVIKEKKEDREEIKLVFEHGISQGGTASTTAGKFYLVRNEIISFEVMKSDLNLTLIINGSKDDQGVGFGETLNYSVVYNNKGETEMKDVVVMAVFESAFLDWASLTDNLKGKRKGGTISWSKAEIPELEVLETNEEGTIDFSLRVADIDKIDPKLSYEVKSYVQYSVGNKEDFSDAADNRSNTIVNKINSDLGFTEQIRYFSADNIPVGTGPHPPKVGEATSYKVYWELANTLHELSGLAVSVTLPDYVIWDGKDQASVGAVRYDSETRLVTWDIGRLPVTVLAASAEWSLKITPTEADKNKIMVLLPGSKVKATDSVTKAELDVATKAKTTRLDDDDIAQGDGIVD